MQVGLEVPGNDSVVNPVKNPLNIDGKSARILPSQGFCQKGESLFLAGQKKWGESLAS